ncbi:MAG: hypothetical protein GMKNLPBB_00784 [Myxococcota bacterium]|nr:hypothetical protein [Myxococcota bacterium]
MVYDLIVINVVLLLAIWGYWSGFFKQIIPLIAFVAASLLARILIPWLTPVIASLLDIPHALCMMISAAASWLIWYLGISFVLARVVQPILRRIPLVGLADRVLGVVAAFAKAAFLAWVVTCVIALVEPRSADGHSNLWIDTHDSLLVEQVRTFNPITAYLMPSLGRILDDVRFVAREPVSRVNEALGSQAKGPQTGNSSLDSLLSNRELINELRVGGLFNLLQSREFHNVLTDPYAAARLSEVVEKLRNPSAAAKKGAIAGMMTEVTGEETPESASAPAAAAPGNREAPAGGRGPSAGNP